MERALRFLPASTIADMFLRGAFIDLKSIRMGFFAILYRFETFGEFVEDYGVFNTMAGIISGAVPVPQPSDKSLPNPVDGCSTNSITDVESSGHVQGVRAINEIPKDVGFNSCNERSVEAGPITEGNEIAVRELTNQIGGGETRTGDGTGTFGRVCLCREKSNGEYGALKILSIGDVIRLKQVEHVKNEKNILQQIRHPFIVELKWHHRDSSFLYMLFEYVCGGELFSYLRNAGRFSTSTGNFYATEIVMALEYLHSQSVVYRDLKPENLLLDKDGHLKITDFGFAKKLTDRTWTLCGTPEYLAPEIIQSKGHNKAVDWWALGVLIYEMLSGYPPFFDDNPFGIYEKILAGKVEWPRHVDPVAKDLIKKLLVQDRTKRLGNMKNGAEDVKRHRWFKGVDWKEVYHRKLKPPIVPRVTYDGDTRNFDDYPETDWQSTPSVGEKEQKLFEDF